MSWTLVVALCALVVGIVNLTWNIYVALRDRARLKLEAMLGLLTSTPWDKKTPTLLILTMANVGRRPLTVRGWYCAYDSAPGKKAHGFIVTSGLPKQLKESEQHIESCSDWRHLFERGLKTMYVVDTSGHEWHLTKKQLTMLRKMYQREINSERVP